MVSIEVEGGRGGDMLPAAPADRLAALGELRRNLNGPCAGPPAAHLMKQLLQQLPAPNPALYADVGDAPAPPAAGEAAALAATWAAAVALQLELVAALVERMNAADLGLEALAATGTDSSSHTALPGPAGSVRIEELDAAAPTTALPAAAVLAAALYGGDSQLTRPWAPVQVAGAAQQLLVALAAKLAGALPERPGSQAAPLLQGRTAARAGSSRPSRQQPADVQQLLALAAPAALQRLRPVVAAKVEHSRHSTARLELYSGPGNFERCVAAGQLAWLLRQLGGRHLSSVMPQALPLVLVAAEDPFPPTQACGLRALEHLAAECQAGDLRPHAQLVLRAAKAALAGCSEASWPAAAAAAVAVVGSVEGSNPYAQSYHDVLGVFLSEAELGGHQVERAAAWLAAAPLLFPRLGLQLAAHAARLLPLLLGWCTAPQRCVRAAALGALLQAVRLAWPRMGAHAAAIWPVLRRAHQLELGSRQPHMAGESQAAASVADRAEDCALALWYAGGTDFQVHLMTGRGATDDELLLAVMERLEASGDGSSEQPRNEAAAGVVGQARAPGPAIALMQLD